MRPTSTGHLAPEDAESRSATEYRCAVRRTPARLTSAIARLESGSGAVHELDELD